MTKQETGNHADHVPVFQRHVETNNDAHTGSELLHGADEAVTPSSGRGRETRHRSSLLNDTAREALIGPYRNQTAALLTVASSGAFIFLVINLVGVLLCKGYFRKRTPSCRPSSLYLQSLSQSRRSRYSTLLRRFSLESYTYSCCEQTQDPPIGVSTGHNNRIAETRWFDLSAGLVMPEDILSPPVETTVIGAAGSSSAALSPSGLGTYDSGIHTRPDQAQLCALLSELRKVKSSKVKTKRGKRSKSFDDNLLFSTTGRIGTKVTRSGRLVQINK